MMKSGVVRDLGTWLGQIVVAWEAIVGFVFNHSDKKKFYGHIENNAIVKNLIVFFFFKNEENFVFFLIPLSSKEDFKFSIRHRKLI